MASFRSTPRANMAREASYERAGESHIGTLIDLSESGAKMISSEKSAIKVGDVVEIHWAPLPGLKPFHIQGKCVWKNQGQAGLRFVEIEPRLRYVLRSLIKFHLG